MSKKASLQELVDLNELQTIQDSFAKTAGTSSVIFSPEGEPLTQFSNLISFCSLIQSTEEGKRRCFLSFMEMSRKALELEEPVIQYCFVRGGHFVAPIIIDGEHKGTMFTGQFIPQKFSPEQLKALEKIAVEINVDPNLLVEEAKKMRVVEEDRAWNHSSLLFQIVEVITRLGAQATELGRAKDALQKAHNGLEIRVQERTVELAKSNEELKQEITERKQAEEALRESEEKIRSITASAHDAIIMVDNEGTTSFWNEAAEMIFGYTEEEMIGTKLHDSIVPERFRGDFLKGFKSFRETGQGAAVGKTLELAANRRDGTELPVELSLSAIKLKGQWNAIGLLRDITERKQAEAELIEVKEWLNYTIQNMKDIIFSIDLMGNYTYTNVVAAEITGYSVDELLKMNMRELVAPEYHELVFGRVKKRIAGEPLEQPLSIEIISKDGKRTWLELTTSAAHDKAGKVIGIQGIARDITERKQAENTIKKKNEELKRFNKLAVGRELRMIELKKEINALLVQLGEEPRYKIVGEGFKKNYELG
ncbi:MAG: PAS domain S-box protein [Halobacteriota archaeon]